MTTFNNFNNRLPDPDFIVNDAGAVDTVGTAAPGFAGIGISAIRDDDVSRTVSGRGVTRDMGSHRWDISIKYNPMFRDQFDVVSSFLEARNGRINPFFVVLPQYKKPKMASFATFAGANPILVKGLTPAGSSTVMIDSAVPIAGDPKPGDFFNINDPADTNHVKAYKVTRVETNATYQIGKPQPSTSERRIHITPSLVKNTADNSAIIWINPSFRVIQKGGVLETDLNTDNLWSFGLNLEEIQP